ncbi:MAG TPA: Ig-like domain-containing protein, partial [Candidatus Deferrimicrobiaceae bacterium]|nr:Ig-like domain-containing protein [Candidatus Deferrimicrobiaceae bacterium]
MAGAWQRLRDRVPAAMVGKGMVSFAIVALVAIFIVQISGGPVPSPSPSPRASQTVAQPTGTPGPTGSPAPTPTPEPWEEFELPPVVLAAELTPDRAGAAGVARDSTFTLRSLDGTPALELAQAVQSQPALDLEIRAGATPDVATLAPREPLLEGVLYRFRVFGTDGALGGTWAFRAEQPLHVVGTLPGDIATAVPIDTGIEVTFDQDGTTGVASHFRIEPAVAGRFESHGRTWAFIPDQPLQHATAYTVTVARGVAITGSSQILEADVSFRFETELEGSAIREYPVAFDPPLVALRPSDRIALLIGYDEYDDDDDGRVERPETLPVDIYRLPGRDATVAAAERLMGPDSWLRASGAGLVPTDDLRLVAEVDGRLVRDSGYKLHLVLPVDLDPGAYLVVVPRERRPAQAVLQIRTLSAYAVTTDTRSVAWVNDLGSLEGVGGAVVASADGRQLGVTAADGLAEFPTPERLMPRLSDSWWAPWPTVVSITAPGGRWIVAALGAPTGSWLDWQNNRPSAADQPSNRYWLLLETDRGEYRQTDTIHAWGVARLRADRSVPDAMELRLYPAEGRPEVPLARVPVKASASGTFALDVPVATLSLGTYVLALFVDGRETISTWLYVTVIRKPSYRLEISTDKHVYLDGEPMAITIRASFFDGTTLPNAQLRVVSEGESRDEANLSRTVTTDADGYATVTLAARYLDRDREGWSHQGIRVSPVNPEEGDISDRISVMVFASRAWLAGQAKIDGTTITASGRLSLVDFAGINAAVAARTWSWDSDPAGQPIGGGRVTATLIEHVTTVRQTGTEYDFIEKKVVPVYRYDYSERTVGTYETTTAADGSFRFTLAAPTKSDDYTIVLRAADDAGRQIRETLWVDSPEGLEPGFLSYLLPGGGCGGTPSTTVGLGESVVLTLHDGDGSVASEGRFLFLVASGGLVDAVVSGDSTIRRTFRDGLLPGFTVRVVQARGAGYVTADANVRPDLGDLRVTVGLAPDRERYAPGDTAAVKVTTTGPDGSPVAADVVLQGVDEKLYAIGAASVGDPTATLFRPIDAGFLQGAVTHSAMRTLEGGCGATGGEGGREDFGDSVTFQLVRTGADGRATATFKLLDDLTSWRITAFAITNDLRTGRGSVKLPVSLPFFVEAVLAPDYLVGEQPILRVRAYGDALRAGDDVAFTVSAPSLGLAETRVSGTAFEPVRIPLPKLTQGDHRITIAGRGPATALRDTLVRVVHVIPTRMAGFQTRYDALTAAYQPPGGEGLTRYLIVDAGRGSLIPLLDELTSSTSARFDRAFAAELARRTLIDGYGVDPATLPSVDFDVTRYQRGLVALLPYSSGELELTALATLVAPERLNGSQVREWLDDEGASALSTREREIVVLAALAGLGDDVLDDLRSFEPADLTIREQLWLALGFAAAGDENAARAIERQLLDAHGQRFGPWVRLEVGSSLEDTLEGAGLLLVLASRLGERFAPDVARYLADHPSR